MNNKFWNHNFSAKEISEAKIREAIIVSWKEGKKLSGLVKDTGIDISRQAWSVARKRYEKYGLAGLLSRRGLKGGRKKKILTSQLTEVKELVSEDIKLKKFQDLLKERLEVTVSYRQCTRLIKNIGITRKRGGLKKIDSIDKEKGTPIDNAGAFFLKGADSDIEGVKSIVEEILKGRLKSIPEETSLKRLRENSFETLRKRVESLLYLPIFDMQKPYHLRNYHKRGLGALSGSKKRYSYFTLDLFLGDLEKIKISKSVGDALARCYIETLCIRIELEDGSYFYIDGHTKHLWSDKNIPKAYFTTLKRAERGLNQYFIHSSKGNPLILLTCPGDTRLPGVLFELIDAFENAIGKKIIKAAIFDREGLSLEIFEEFDRRKKYFITLLKEDMYKEEESFTLIKDYKPFKTEEIGDELKVVSWVAEAKFVLKEKTKKIDGKSSIIAKRRELRVALVKKPIKNKYKFIPIITNISKKEEPKIELIAKKYFERWPNEENIFKYAMEAFKVDTNHGYKKQVVENRVVMRKKEELATNLRGISKRLAKATSEREKVSSELNKHQVFYNNLKKDLKKETEELYKKLSFLVNEKRKCALLKKLKQLESKKIKLAEKYGKILLELKTTLKIKEKYEKSVYTQKQNKEIEINELDLGKPLFENQTEKDHFMSNLKTLLINLSSYAKRQYFPSKYHNYTLESMKKAFWQQNGYIKEWKKKIVITLNSYYEPELQEDVLLACEKFNESDLKDEFGRKILMEVDN